MTSARKRPSDRSKQRRAGLVSSFFHRTPVAVGGLVCAGVLAGFLFYLQAGLLVGPAAPILGHNQPAAGPVPHDTSIEVPKASALDAQDSVDIPSPKTKAPAPKAVQGSKREACDEKLDQAAKQAHERSLAAEKDFHAQMLKRVSKFSKLLSKLSLGAANDKIIRENDRHRQALALIEDTYQSTLTEANCQGL